MLSQERLKSLFHYDPETGVFTRRVDMGRSRAGSIVGYTNGRGWLRVKIDYKHYKLHRLAFLYMEGEFPPDEVDHINGDRGDNRWANLRKATKSQNQANKLSKGNSKTGYPGVIPSGQFYKASVICNGEKHYSKSFSCPLEAYRERERMRRRLFGDFA